MVQEINIKDFLESNLPLIDVRSPGEYDNGHIPGAINIPLFSDAERAHIGTVYVQQSKEKAFELGYQYANPKLNNFITESKKVATDKKVAVHCWRGGMRSKLFAQHLNDNGFNSASIISGGYKAYRRNVLQTFDIPFNLKIVGGYSGSGKTLVIEQLKSNGFQAIDLENLARHKGSAFGAIGQQPQPTEEQFENNLFDAWRNLDYSKPIWLEDESFNIGGVNLPKNLFDQMRNSDVYFLDIPKEERARHLVTEYVNAPADLLIQSINRLTKRLGGQNTKDALRFLDEKKHFEVALLTLSYYDKSYLKGMRFHDEKRVIKIPSKNTNPVENTKLIMQFYEQHERYKINPV